MKRKQITLLVQSQQYPDTQPYSHQKQSSLFSYCKFSNHVQGLQLALPQRERLVYEVYVTYIKWLYLQSCFRVFKKTFFIKNCVDHETRLVQTIPIHLYYLLIMLIQSDSAASAYRQNHSFTILACVGMHSLHILLPNILDKWLFFFFTVENVLDEIPDSPHKTFMNQYLKDWPFPHLTQYRVGQTLNAELNGVQQRCEVQVVDSSLIQVVFQVSIT